MLAGDPRGSQRGAIQRGRSPSAADGHDGDIHGDLIEILAVGPASRNPPTGGGENRLTWLGLRHGLSKPVRHLRQRRDTDHVDAPPRYSSAGVNMVVIVRQA